MWLQLITQNKASCYSYNFMQNVSNKNIQTRYFKPIIYQLFYEKFPSKKYNCMHHFSNLQTHKIKRINM